MIPGVGNKGRASRNGKGGMIPSVRLILLPTGWSFALADKVLLKYTTKGHLIVSVFLRPHLGGHFHHIHMFFVFWVFFSYTRILSA